MCGIAGKIGREGSADITIEGLLARISHRGPDGSGIWKQNGVELAHARLSIIDLSDEASQPMRDEETGNVLVFNGEIYNYVELREQLRHLYKFKTNSDTEVILACYRVHGVEALNMLRGMFAIALFDSSRNAVLLARDRIGIKPLYLRRSPGALLFASEIKALVQWGEGESLEEQKVFEFLANRQLDCDHRTFFKEVTQLRPAHYVWCGPDGSLSEPQSFWEFPVQGRKVFNKSAEDELRRIFSETVALHLRSDVPVGSFLSGGLDSTSVACFAIREMKQPVLHTFSAVLPYFHPENSLIKDVIANEARIEPHNFLLDGEHFFRDIHQVIFHHDEPVLDGSMYAHYKLCELARQSSVKVLLSGSGGDELFGGYASYVYAHLAKQLRSGRLLSFLAHLKTLHASTGISYQNLAGKAVQDCLPFGLRRKLKMAKLRKQFGFVEISTEVPHYYFEHSDPYYANQINNYKSWTVPPYLHYEDRNSMAFGVEVRVPFYDHKLIEFVLQFDDSCLIKGSSKTVMRSSFRGIVPDMILDQKGKYGFPSPIDHALKNDNEGKQLFFDLCEDTPFLNKEATRRLGQAFYQGKAGVDVFWRTLSYILWYNIYFKGRRPELSRHVLTSTFQTLP